MTAFRSLSSNPASVARRGLFLLSVLLLSSNSMVWAFLPSAGNSLKLHTPVQISHQVLETAQTGAKVQSRLYSSRAATQYTEFEILDMKRRVLSISTESNDETRRAYVSKWITG